MGMHTLNQVVDYLLYRMRAEAQGEAQGQPQTDAGPVPGGGPSTFTTGLSIGVRCELDHMARVMSAAHASTGCLDRLMFVWMALTRHCHLQ